MIPALRGAALLANTALFFGVPHVAGLAWPWAGACGAALFLASWWISGRMPRSETAPAPVADAAARVARRLGAPPPRLVRRVPGWTAGALRRGRGYAVLLGAEVEARHHEAVLAHEMAHYVTGDLWWEPFTDGPARLLLELGRAVPPFSVIAFPFLVFGAPLARATELRADRLAADAVEGYAATLREVADKMGSGTGLLYPSLAARVRSARDVKSVP